MMNKEKDHEPVDPVDEALSMLNNISYAFGSANYLYTHSTYTNETDLIEDCSQIMKELADIKLKANNIAVKVRSRVVKGRKNDQEK